MRFSKTEFVLGNIIFLAFTAAVYGSVCLYIHLQKPLFVNDFGYGFYGSWSGVLPAWSPRRSDLRDSAGTRYLADFKGNVFVIVQVPTEKTPPVVPLGSMNAKFALLHGEPLTLKCDSNVLHRIRLDRTIEWKTLRPGDAEKLFRAIEQQILVEQLIKKGGEVTPANVSSGGV